MLFGGWAGAIAGLGGTTFHYAHGTSYLSSDPSVCVNCHIMQPQYDAWQRASHHAVAGCVDCHLPADFAGKYLAKMRNGWNHSLAFTLQNFPEPIRITPGNARILEANCRRCHAELVSGLHEQGEETAQLRCASCHAGVGHGEMAGLGGARRPDETE
jgi:cytochrome c nitrite reductase small subunit